MPRATKSDIATLQVGYIAESLAVEVYSAIRANFSSFKGLENKDYFQKALQNEKDHKAAWAKALGSKTPRGFQLSVPGSAVSTRGHALLVLRRGVRRPRRAAVVPMITASAAAAALTKDGFIG